MSRYDYQDPGTDPNYCNGLSADVCEVCREDIPNCLCQTDVIDPAEHAYHAAVDAFSTLEVELAKCSDTKRAWVLRRLTQALDRRATDVMQAAASKLDDLVS